MGTTSGAGRALYLELEIPNFDVAPRAHREPVTERAGQSQAVKIGIPPLLESKLGRIGIAGERAVFGLAAYHHDICRPGAIPCPQIPPIPPAPPPTARKPP